MARSLDSDPKTTRKVRNPLQTLSLPGYERREETTTDMEVERAEEQLK